MLSISGAADLVEKHPESLAGLFLNLSQAKDLHRMRRNLLGHKLLIICISVLRRRVFVPWVEVSLSDHRSFWKIIGDRVACELPKFYVATGKSSVGAGVDSLSMSYLLLASLLNASGDVRNAIAPIVALFPDPRPPMRVFRLRDSGSVNDGGPDCPSESSSQGQKLDAFEASLITWTPEIQY